MTASSAFALPITTSYAVGLLRLDTPMPDVLLPCGSKSTSSVFFPSLANAAVRFTLVVVLPTPPFWLATAITLPISLPPLGLSKSGAGGAAPRLCVRGCFAAELSFLFYSTVYYNDALSILQLFHVKHFQWPSALGDVSRETLVFRQKSTA